MHRYRTTTWLLGYLALQLHVPPILPGKPGRIITQTRGPNLDHFTRSGTILRKPATRIGYVPTAQFVHAL
jgi:hypothetical protein